MLLSYIELFYLMLNLRNKGEAQGGTIPLTRLPLNPTRLDPRLLLRRAKFEAFLSESFLGRENCFEWIYVFSHRFLIIGHLKIANSLRSDSAIFLTVPLIRNHCLVDRRYGFWIKIYKLIYRVFCKWSRRIEIWLFEALAELSNFSWLNVKRYGIFYQLIYWLLHINSLP